MKKVKICKHCSNFDVKEMKSHAKNLNCKLKFGCLGKCKRKCPELSDKYWGLIDNNLIVCDCKENFYKHMEE